MRTAYLLSTNFESKRTLFSKALLEKIGFSVILFMAIKHNDKIISNKISMQKIYETIINNNNINEWTYIFEDDINIIGNITIDELIEYEKVSDKIMYLGLCTPKPYKNIINLNKTINGYNVYKTNGNTRGLHAIGLSLIGCKELLTFSKTFTDYDITRYMDVILERFTELNNSVVVKYDLASPYDIGHRGVFYQDRVAFPSEII